MCAECVQRSLLSVIRDFLIRNDQYLQRYVEVAYLEYRTVSDVHNVNVRHENHCGAITPVMVFLDSQSRFFLKIERNKV